MMFSSLNGNLRLLVLENSASLRCPDWALGCANLTREEDAMDRPEGSGGMEAGIGFLYVASW